MTNTFWFDGACVRRGVVPPDVIEAGREAVEALVGTAALADLSALAGVDESPRFRAGVDHWRSDGTIARIATDSVVPRVVAEVLQTDRLWLYEDSVLVKEAGSTVTTRWHTDDGYFHVDGRSLATVWIPLDPAPLVAGALRFARGSHLDSQRYRPTMFVTDDPIPGTDGAMPSELASDDPRVFGFDLDVGDLTVHHARTLHAASGNHTDRPRRALSIRYCGDDAVIRVKAGAPTKSGFDAISPGTPIADAAEALGLHEVDLT